jgi:hypothetical protein
VRSVVRYANDKNFWDGKGGGGPVGLLLAWIGDRQVDSGLVMGSVAGRQGEKERKGK